LLANFKHNRPIKQTEAPASQKTNTVNRSADRENRPSTEGLSQCGAKIMHQVINSSYLNNYYLYNPIVEGNGEINEDFEGSQND